MNENIELNKNISKSNLDNFESWLENRLSNYSEEEKIILYPLLFAVYMQGFNAGIEEATDIWKRK